MGRQVWSTWRGSTCVIVRSPHWRARCWSPRSRRRPPAPTPASGRRPATRARQPPAGGSGPRPTPGRAARAPWRHRCRPVRPGSVTPYFPLEGNGGYDVRHYDLTFSYDPATDRLDGTTRSGAGDPEPVAPRPGPPAARRGAALTVNGTCDLHARWPGAADHAEAGRCRQGRALRRERRYGGVPQTIVGSPIVFGSPYGFVHTNDGAFMGDEPTRRHVDPDERPPGRQGDVDDPRDGAGRASA